MSGPYLDRKSYLGGSDISAIIGCDPWASPMTVYNRKIGLSEKQEVSFAMRRGTHFEPGIMSLYAEINDCWLGPAGVTPPHPMFSFLKGNYDRVRLSGKNGHAITLIEAKTANMRQAAKWGEPEADEKKVPVNYYVQANYYCGLLSLPKFEIVAYLTWKDDLHVYEFDFNEQVFDDCCEAAAAFWYGHVLPRVPPPPESGKSTFEDMVKLWPESTGEIIAASAQIEQLWGEAFEAYKQKRSADEVLNRFKAAVQFEAKEASAVQFVDGVVKIVDKRGNPAYKDIAAHFASLAGVEIGSDGWNETVAKFTGKATRYIKIPWSGDFD